MSTDTLESKILSLLSTSPGQKAAHIARELGIPRKDVNHHLYGSLSEKVAKDEEHCWRLTSDSESGDTSIVQAYSPPASESVDASSDISWLFRRVGADEVETEITQLRFIKCGILTQFDECDCPLASRRIW